MAAPRGDEEKAAVASGACEAKACGPPLREPAVAAASAGARERAAPSGRGRAAARGSPVIMVCAF